MILIYEQLKYGFAYLNDKGYGRYVPILGLRIVRLALNV
jgi:hypothetical protein